MNLSHMTDAELAELIRQASSELVSRMTRPDVDRIPFKRPKVAMREPSEDDKDFVLRLKTRVHSGGYASAADRQRIADLAENFESWIRAQGLPTSRGTGEWRKLAEYSRVKPARER